jgi:GTPase involved in cell partitioning and DNA repair
MRVFYSPGRKRPSGGSGGRGGNVFVVGDPELFSLKFNTYHFNGENGRHGGSKRIA